MGLVEAAMLLAFSQAVRTIRWLVIRERMDEAGRYNISLVTAAFPIFIQDPIRAKIIGRGSGAGILVERAMDAVGVVVIAVSTGLVVGARNLADVVARILVMLSAIGLGYASGIIPWLWSKVPADFRKGVKHALGNKRKSAVLLVLSCLAWALSFLPMKEIAGGGWIEMLFGMSAATIISSFNPLPFGAGSMEGVLAASTSLSLRDAVIGLFWYRVLLVVTAFLFVLISLALPGTVLPDLRQLFPRKILKHRALA